MRMHKRIGSSLSYLKMFSEMYCTELTEGHDLTFSSSNGYFQVMVLNPNYDIVSTFLTLFIRLIFNHFY